MQRVEWRTNAANTRSISVAKRLGMRRDGTLRQVYPGPAGRVDIEVWSVLAAEWSGGPARVNRPAAWPGGRRAGSAKVRAIDRPTDRSGAAASP
jgi:hypothetical protein